MEVLFTDKKVVRKIVGQLCTRCIYDESVAMISFDEEGVCNYCRMVENLKNEYRTGTPEGEQKILQIIKEIKNDGKGKKYDCIIGVSGGTDSSYMVHWAVQHGLRCLAVHYDNTWNTAIATENIRKVLTKLNVDLFTLVANNKEADDIYRSFVLADVPEFEAPTDLALAETLYRAAAKFNVRYVLEGHSFIAEGITPLGKNYFDGKYIKHIHDKFGRVSMKTYPLMSFYNFMKWTLVKRIKKIRPLWYIDYTKEDAKILLEREYGWQDYGGHHLENRAAAFFHSYYLPRKFHIDFRNNSLSASVRSGKLSREDAIDKYFYTPPYLEPELYNYSIQRLGFTKDEFETIMSRPPKYWYEYPTYKKRFERLRPLFYLLMRAHLVPHSFYLKYCFPAAKNSV